MAFNSFLRDTGIPFASLMRRNALPILCDDPDHFVPLSRAWSFFDCLARYEDPMVGWRTGSVSGDQNLNAALLHDMESAPTLFRALQQFVRMARMEASQIELGMCWRHDDLLIFTHYSDMADRPGYRVSQAYQLEVILGLLRHFLGRRWSPAEIGVEGPVEVTDLEPFFPNTRIRNEQPFGYIVLPRELLHLPASRAELDFAADKEPMPVDGKCLIDTLRAVLPAYLHDGYPSAALAARLISASERTLARRLAERGLSYGGLIDDIRFREAKRLLQDPAICIGEVARAVGFEDQSNFTRMFRRIAALTPGEYRNTTVH
jgi:AraC-like DNA-binding protein